jgi:hypothetical protein
MKTWLDQIEQLVTMKHFFLKRHGSKLIDKELVSTPQDNAISLSTVKNWLKRFKSDHLSCDHEERPGRRLISLGPLFGAF